MRYLTLLVGAFSCAVYASGPIAFPAAKPRRLEHCRFDHQLMTLFHDSYVSIQTYLMDQKNSAQIGVTWENDPQGYKGFLHFSDGNYLEIFDASKANQSGFGSEDLGFQEACRVLDLDTITQVAQRYRVVPNEPIFNGMILEAAVGRRGFLGDPRGGLFFFYVNPDAQGYPVFDPTKFGVRKILKNVPADLDGKPNSNLSSDYRGAEMRVGVRHNVLRASDSIGVTRIAISDPAYPVGLIAVRFSRQGQDSADLAIPKSSESSEQFRLQLRPGFGTLVLQPHAYEATSNLFEE